jgi:hypothetical protein
VSEKDAKPGALFGVDVEGRAALAGIRYDGSSRLTLEMVAEALARPAAAPQDYPLLMHPRDIATGVREGWLRKLPNEEAYVMCWPEDSRR